MQLLEPAELEAVLAHEVTHIVNRDVAIMTLASFFASVAAMIVQFGCCSAAATAAAATTRATT